MEKEMSNVVLALREVREEVKKLHEMLTHAQGKATPQPKPRMALPIGTEVSFPHEGAMIKGKVVGQSGAWILIMCGDVEHKKRREAIIVEATSLSPPPPIADTSLSPPPVVEALRKRERITTFEETEEMDE